ncbi:MAG: hypothetical protein AB8B99_11005 [Phormidesmis sp.]
MNQPNINQPNINQPNINQPNGNQSNESGIGVNYSPDLCTPDLAEFMSELLDDAYTHLQTAAPLTSNSISSTNSERPEELCQLPIRLSDTHISHSQPTSLQDNVMQPVTMQPLLSQKRPNQPPVDSNAANSSKRSRVFNTPPDEQVAAFKRPTAAPPENRTAPPPQIYTLDTWKGTIQPTALRSQPNNVIAHPAQRITLAPNTTQPNTTQPNTTKPASARSSVRPASAKATPTNRLDFIQVPPAPNAKRTAQRINVYQPEPARQSSTYQVPLRSTQTPLKNAIMRSFPRTLILFLLGTGLAGTAGLAFPSLISVVTLGSMVSILMRGLAIAMLCSLAAAFVLEFR